MCRTLPKEYTIKTNSYLNEAVYTQVSVHEMHQFKLKRMPLYIDHESGITHEKKENLEPIKINATGKSILGYVVDTYITDEQSLLNVVEIPLTDDVATKKGRLARMAKLATIAMIQNGTLPSVSLAHLPESDSYGAEGIEIIKKHPLELSLTNNPDRIGSDILFSYFSDDPYLALDDCEETFKALESGSKIGVDFHPDEVVQVEGDEVEEEDGENNNNKIHEKVEDEPLEAEEEEEDMADKKTVSPTASELAELQKQVEALRKENEDLKPMAKEYTRRKQQEAEERKQNFVKSENEIHGFTKEILKMLTASGIAIDDADKPVFEAVIAAPDTAHDETVKQIESIILPDATTTVQPTSDELYSRLETVMGRIANDIVVCHRATNKYLTPLLEFKKKSAAVAAQAAAVGAAGTAKVASVPAQQEPIWSKFEDMQKKINAKRDKMYVDNIPELKRD